MTKHWQYHRYKMNPFTRSFRSKDRLGKYAYILALDLVLGLIILMIVFPILSSASASSFNSTAGSNVTGPIDLKEMEAFMDGVVNAQLKAHNIPGSTVAVVKDGQVVFVNGYGYAELEKRKPVAGNQTLFRIGSVSKLFIWTAVMQLAEQGKLDLDADINIYLKDFQIPATYSRPITMKNLMSHTSGFEDLAIGGRVFVRSSAEVLPLDKYLKTKMPPEYALPGN